MDREKVIKALESCTAKPLRRKSDKYVVSLDIRFVNTIIALLKEQEAVEARRENDDNPQPWTCWWYVCGDCGQEICYHDRFCRWCGRSVKWE